MSEHLAIDIMHANKSLAGHMEKKRRARTSKANQSDPLFGGSRARTSPRNPDYGLVSFETRDQVHLFEAILPLLADGTHDTEKYK